MIIMLEFSTELKQVATVFKEYKNSIDIYTEDKIEDKAFYEQLLKRLLSDTDIQINDIYPLGCKREVVDACKTNVDKDRRACLYIVDGDIYLQYKDEETIDNLYRLNSYCIENYVICEESVCKTAYELNGGRISIDDIKDKINYSDLLNKSLSLIDLFFWYSIQSELFDKFDLRHVNAFIDNTSRIIDDKKIKSRIEEIKNSLLDHSYSEEKLESIYKDRMQKYGKTAETLLKIVSGKDYLIPLLCNWINHKICKIEIPKESWKYHLSKTCSLDGLEELKNTIISIVKQ